MGEVHTGHHSGRAGVLQKKGPLTLLQVAALLLVLNLLGPPPAWCAQVVFPSTDVTTCSYSDASTPTCETKLLVQWIIYGGGSNLALSVQLDNGVNFTDQYGRPWGAAQPINIQLSLLNSRIEYGMTYKGMYRNAYEKRVRTQSTASQCPTNHKCCSDVSYFPWLGYDASLAFNSTTWYGYALGFGVWKYDVQVALSQGTLYQGLFLNSVTPSASLSGISVTLHSPQVNQNKLTNYNYYTYMLPSTNVSLPGSGFLVPDGNIGILPNQIGVLTDQWLGAYQCNQALGLKTMVQTANPYDQFAAFRSSSLEAENPTSGCLVQSNASNANPFSTSPLLQTFACPDVGSMRVQMEISSASYKLQALYGVPLITGSGMYALSPTDAYATIYLDCSNSGTYDGVFTFQPVNCCVTRWPSTTCSGVTFQSASTVTVPPSGAARVTFIVDSRQVLGANGTCAFDVLQHARVEQRVTATFDTSLIDYLSGGVPITSDAPDCFAPYIIVQKGSTRYCVPPCTQDQDWDASMSVCRGVDCSLKYLGARNWYNLTAGLCQAAATCTSAQTYVSSNNSCVNKTATIVAINCTSAACSLDTTLFTPVTLTIDCGEHGTYANHSCNCTEGYTTVFGDRVTNSSALGWCTTLVVASSSSSVASSLMVAVVALGLGLGLCCCGFAVSTGGLLYLQARARKRWARERLEHHHAAQAREQQLLTLQLTAMNQWPGAQPPTPADLSGPPLPGSQRCDGDHRDDSDEADHHEHDDDVGDDDEEAQQAAGDDGWHNYYNTGFEGGGGRARSAAATTRYTVRVVSGTLPVWQQRLQQQQQLKEQEKEEKEAKEKKEAEAPQERGWRRGRRRRGVNEMATLLGEHLNFLWTNLAGFTRSPSATAAPTPDHPAHDHDHDGQVNDRADGEEDDRPLPAIPTTTTTDGDDDEVAPVEVVETEMVEEGEEVVSPAELLRTIKARQSREDGGDDEEEEEGGDGREAKKRKSGKKKTKKATAKKKRGESSAPPNGLLALVSGYE